MSYDFEGAAAGPPPEVRRDVTPQNPRDLEVLVTLLELAAIMLSPEPGASFTPAALIAEAQRLGGAEVPLDERDLRIVLGGLKSVRRVAGGRLALR